MFMFLFIDFFCLLFLAFSSCGHIILFCGPLIHRLLVYDDPLQNILEKFNPGARQLINAGKSYLKALHGKLPLEIVSFSVFCFDRLTTAISRRLPARVLLYTGRDGWSKWHFSGRSHFHREHTSNYIPRLFILKRG